MSSRFGALVPCVLVILAATAPDARAQWSAEQRSALAVLQAAVDAEKQGDFAKVALLYHEKFTAWNLAEGAPLNRAQFLEVTADFLKTARVVEFEIVPISIEIVKDTAVLTTTYAYTVVPNSGERLKLAGRWGVTLVKNGSAWLFLGCTWVDTK